MDLTKTFLIILSQILLCEGSYRYWSPDGVKDLLCQEYCFSEPTTIRTNHCCACKAKPIWELSFTNTSYHQLDLEIFDVQFQRTKLFSDNNSTYFSFEFEAGKLEKFPKNYCEFNIVKIDVTSNKFREIVNLNCLLNLDTLIMAKNIITHLSNYSFVGMDKLRVLDLSFNRIQTMDLNILTSNGVLSYNFESNEFLDIDTSNIVAPNKTMCKVIYRNNKVQDIEVTNNLNYKLETGTICNDVDFSGMNTSPNVLIGAMGDIETNKILKHVPCGTYMYRGSGFICDCEFVEFFALSFSDINRLYNKSLSEYYCQTPISLFNISINVVYSDKNLIDQMTCDIKDFCHSIESVCECTCISQPSQKRLIVDCSNQSCTDLPQKVPDTKHGITLKMNRNNVQSLNAKDYFHRITLLDLTENPVKIINSDIASLSNNPEVIVTLYDHELQTLPKSIQKLHPDMFRFGTNGIICDCENRWIGEWRKFKKAKKMYPLVCSNYNNALIEDMVSQIKGCKDEEFDYFSKIIFPILLLFMLMGIIVFYRQLFVYNILLLKRRFAKRKRQNPNFWEFDVYLSFDDDNDNVRVFVLQTLEPMLRKHNLRTYCPCRDDLIGSHTEENVISNIRKCKYVLIIQSNDMYNSDVRSSTFITKRLEYKLAWHLFIDETIEKILVVSFDSPDFDKFQYKKSKALNRFAMGFIVTNRKLSFKQKLLDTFNKPISNKRNNRKGRRK